MSASLSRPSSPRPTLEMRRASSTLSFFEEEDEEIETLFSRSYSLSLSRARTRLSSTVPAASLLYDALLQQQLKTTTAKRASSSEASEVELKKSIDFAFFFSFETSLFTGRIPTPSSVS